MAMRSNPDPSRGLGWGVFLAGFVPGLLQFHLGQKPRALLAMSQADDLVVMQQGQIAYAGPCAQPQAHQTLEAVFDHRIAIHPLNGRHVALPR